MITLLLIYANIISTFACYWLHYHQIIK